MDTKIIVWRVQRAIQDTESIIKWLEKNHSYRGYQETYLKGYMDGRIDTYYHQLDVLKNILDGYEENEKNE